MRLLFILAMLLVSALPAHAERRVALVIGNSAYEHVPQLANPKNDATDMAAKLEGLGFEVVRGSDLNLAEMRKTAREFTNKLEGAQLSLFFYAGHGLQVNGINYMAPVDAKLSSYNDLDYEVLSMDLILTAMERNTKVNLIFLDACRDNPLAENLARSMGTRSTAVGRGLAKLGSGVGSLIAFATQPGNVALDGSGRNSPFTTALLKHLGTPGQSVTDDLINVRKEVLDATKGKQVPWDNSSLTGPVILKPTTEAGAPAQSAAPDAATSNVQLELAYWDAIKDATDKGFFEAYLQQYPAGTFAALARLKLGLIEKTAAAQKQALEEQQSEKDRLAADAAAKVEQEKMAREKARLAADDEAEVRAAELKSAEDARKAADDARIAAEKRLAEYEAAQKLRLAEEAKKNEAIAEAEKLNVAKADAKAKEEADKQKAIEIAKLEQPAPAETATELAPVDLVELAIATQKELARIGCLSGKADGKWGAGSERALKDYAGRQGVKLASLQPGAETLERLKATKVRVCPLICGKGMEEKNGRCEKVRQEAKIEPKPEPRQKTQPEKKNSEKQKPTEKSVATNADAANCMECPEGSTKYRMCGAELQRFLNSRTSLGPLYCRKVK